MDLAAGRDDVIHLEVGDPDFVTPGPIIDGALDAARQGFTKYTPNAGYMSLREALARKVREQYDLDVTADEVVVTSGAVTGLATAIFATVDPGDEVLVPDPGWPNYSTISLIVGATPVGYPLPRQAEYLPDFAALERLVSRRTKAIVVNSPGNPTGAVYPGSVTEELVKFASRHDLFLISDEVYEAIVFEGEHVPAARFDDDGRVITISGCSKTYAMTGWRIGYGVASPPIAALMAKLQEPLVSCASSVSQKAAEAALAMPQDVVAEMRDAYRQRRDIAMNLLDGHIIGKPQGAFYALVDVSPLGSDSYAVAKLLLSETGVATAPGETFGELGAGTVRISLSIAPGLLAEGCRRIAYALGSGTSALGGTG